MNWKQAWWLAILAIAGCSAERGLEPATDLSSTLPFVAPNIVANASFETSFQGWTNWSYQAPTNVNRDTREAFVGVESVHKSLPATRVDLGSQFIYPFAHLGLGNQDRLWTRFYFYLDTIIDGGFKFTRYFDAGLNTQFSGLGVYHGSINARFDPETGVGGTPLQVNIASLHGLTRGWHWIETDYWRNGDPTGYPSMAFWLDGVPITRQSGGTLVPPMAWINGRLNAGKRISTRQLGVFELVGLINAGNTIPGNIWIDEVAISTKGRIGP